MKITEADKSLISEAVKKAEAKTSGEILPVIVEKSDFYPAAHFRIALIMGILFSIVFYYNYDFEDPILLLWIQFPGMVLGYALAFVPFLKRLLTTRAEMDEEVHQRAVGMYFENKVSMTRDRTGVMIFVSLLERRVEVLADCGINAKVGKNYWNEIVDALVSNIAHNKIIEGMVSAIDSCGQKLTAAFPIKSDDSNEILDELITE